MQRSLQYIIYRIIEHYYDRKQYLVVTYWVLPNEHLFFLSHTQAHRYKLSLRFGRQGSLFWATLYMCVYSLHDNTLYTMNMHAHGKYHGPMKQSGTENMTRDNVTKIETIIITNAHCTPRTHTIKCTRHGHTVARHTHRLNTMTDASELMRVGWPVGCNTMETQWKQFHETLHSVCLQNVTHTADKYFSKHVWSHDKDAQPQIQSTVTISKKVRFISDIESPAER